jgi:hypothetical protein
MTFALLAVHVVSAWACRLPGRLVFGWPAQRH